MIVPHKYQFIFLKTSKTAGTSIEIALSRICDKGDIITAVSDEDEKIRNELGGNLQVFIRQVSLSTTHATGTIT